VHRSEARLREAQTIARLGDWELDHGRGLFCGSSWTFQLCRLVGVRAVEGGLLHVPLEELFGIIVPEHRERLRQLCGCQPGQGTREAHCRSVVEGQVRELLFSAHGEETTDSSQPEVVGTVQDITDRVAALESLRRAESRLMESKRIEAVGRLAGGVAHEFNNLLQAILGYSSMLARRLDEGSRERMLVEPILTAGGRARELVNQILLVGRQGAFAPQTMSLPEFVERFVPTVDTVLNTSRPTKVETEPCPVVWADPGLLEQALMNLCQNAVQATTEQGEVTVSVAPVELPDGLPAVGSVIHRGSYVRLTVADTGVGISADTLARVVEPFFTTRPVGQGSGLGLSAVQGIARQHNAHLTVHSQPGEGTRVSVYFVPHGEAAVSGGECCRPGALPDRVLVVAADEMVLGILALHLGELCCDVLAAAQIGEARSAIADRRQAINALVVDPQGLGDIADWLAQCAERMPVVAVLGDGAGDDAAALVRGVVSVPRPVTAESLRQALKAATQR
jgi:signal transduction histidine kinase